MISIETAFDSLLHESISKKASDIHLDLHDDINIIFRRHKKQLYKRNDEMGIKLYDFLRYKSNFDLSKGSQPQTGSFTYLVNGKEYFFRFAALETLGRKHGVLRILNINPIDTFEASMPLKSNRNKLLKSTEGMSGIILFSGATGSGKSTTMFNFSKAFENKTLFSLENPIERHYPHLVQMEVNEARSFSFQTGVTQLLRHDPDLIILGEVRSENDLKQCIRCGLSGHLVLASVHSGSIQQTLNRLLDLGANTYDLSESLKAIVHQEMIFNEADIKIKYVIETTKEIKERIRAKHDAERSG